MKKVIVNWLDSNTLHGWQYGEYPVELAQCETIGFMVEEDDERLVIAQTVSNYGAHMGITIIAKGCIKSIRELRIK
jgi:hypothetical protein